MPILQQYCGILDMPDEGITLMKIELVYEIGPPLLKKLLLFQKKLTIPKVMKALLKNKC